MVNLLNDQETLDAMALIYFIDFLKWSQESEILLLIQEVIQESKSEAVKLIEEIVKDAA